MGRRRRRWREPVLVWWAAFALMLALAGATASWRVLLLTLLVWCLYEFALVPTVCRVMPRNGHVCREPVRGRLFGCTPAHQRLKVDALRHLVRLPGRRRRVVADPNRDTGMVVASGGRTRLAQADQTVLVLAALGTVVTLIGMVYGLGAG
ncbi:hypothetical protein [Thermomonospora cellulosilytica]|uniref:Uncharacterized protein n=1 Tax=Thermomonospora cellulosilytica TaxID=1411118 RepID=A0A7W3MWK3_9ACTN|nr:hypothetical protein [Thermomonospora cellulosilytica]MBA9003228.1 hypothetical protein [Thermomonospora cellulosilytica]